ncbi:MAG TPA: hypothetical protein VGS57_05855, partial [Thermoanaerobaculia bacterium]|nr:hypothetical protein [Thermoanaerobaculia bacterium]
APNTSPVGGLIVHYTVTNFGANPRPVIKLDPSSAPFDFRLPMPWIDFETGDLSEWSGSFP